MINSDAIPLSLYIHVPWCEKKCPYCDFNSHENQQFFDESRYVKKLLEDLDDDIYNFQHSLNRPIQSIFIGGGTPSLFSATSFKTLLTEISLRLDIDQAEITLEANPSSSEQRQFVGYREAGINRLSIGTQSYHNEMLKRIGRVHDRSDAIDAAESAKSAGFENFNLDIMFALPRQNLQEAVDDIKQAISFSPQHISCYQLTIEPNTLFHQQRPKLPSNETAWKMQAALQNELSKAGYDQYEVSAYAQTSFQCLHNLNYWQFGDYLAIGAGAHGKMTTQTGEIYRFWKQKQPKQYLKATSIDQRRGGISTIQQADLAFGFMLNALRLKNGFELSWLTERTGLYENQIETVVQKNIDLQLLTKTDGRIMPTERGFQLIDSILNDFLPEKSPQ